MSPQSNKWYLARDGKQHGPFSDTDLANFAALGQLQTSDLVWRQGLSNWRSALTIFPEPERAPAQALPPASQPVPAQVNEPRRKEIQLQSRGPTWPMALIALACSALVGAAGGYVFKHYFLINTELTEGSGRQ
jgi:hypothetical protein